MSSAADSLKQAANEAPADEPSQKKVKIEEPNKSQTDNGAITTAKNDSSSTEGGGGGGAAAAAAAAETTAKAGLNNNNNSDVKNNKTIPTKATAAVNGAGQGKGSSSVAEAEVVEDLDDDDDGDDDDELDSLEMGVYGPKISEKLEQVSHIQSEICNLNEKASEEILTVEQKFNKLRRPHFEKRNEILKEIPNFWLTSMANHPMIAPMIESAEDEDCLHYMVNLDVEEFEDIKSGYKLKLHFVDNPYITNEIITKEFQVLSSDDPQVPSTLDKPIEYKDTPQGQKLKLIVEASLEASRQASRVASRVPNQEVPPQSFFAWLTESGTDEIAEILKDQIWPNPLEFFFATPDPYEIDEDDSDDEDEDIDDEDLDDENDADDEDLENLGVDYDEELADEADDEDIEDYDEEVE